MLPTSLMPHEEAVGRNMPDSPCSHAPHDCSFTTAGGSTWKKLHEAVLFQGYKGGSLASSSPGLGAVLITAYKDWPSHHLMQPVRIWVGFAASLQELF